MKSQKLIYGGLFVCASLLLSTISAQAYESKIGGDITVKLEGNAAKIDAQENARVHLAGAKLTGSEIKGSAKITGFATVNGIIDAQKDSVVTIANLNIDGSSVGGKLSSDLFASTGAVTAKEGSRVYLGSADITGSKFSGDLDIYTTAIAKGTVTAEKNAYINIAALKAENVTVKSGNADFKLESIVGQVDAKQDAKVYLSAAELKNVTFNNGVKIHSRSTLGQVKAEKGATVSIASAQLSDATFNGKVDLNLRASVPGGITAKQGSTVEIGGFAMR